MDRQAKQVLTSKERLEIGFDILESVRQRRLRSGDPGVGWAIECRILKRELRDLEEDLQRDPPVLPKREERQNVNLKRRWFRTQRQ